MRMYKLP